MNLEEVAINVHRVPSEQDHTRQNLAIEILDMRLQEGTNDSVDATSDTLVLFQGVSQLILVSLDIDSIMRRAYRRGRVCKP